jgi:hypothetical protein
MSRGPLWVWWIAALVGTAAGAAEASFLTRITSRGVEKASPAK